MDRQERISRVFAWLMRNEGVDPEAIQRAVTSARNMKIGESVCLTGDGQEVLRQAFVNQETNRLLKEV